MSVVALSVMFTVGLAFLTYAFATPGQQVVAAIVGGGLMGWPVGTVLATVENRRRR